MTTEVAKRIIPATPMILHGSWGGHEVGTHEFTMILYAEAGSYFIEWDIPALERTENIGLTFEHKTLVDYDGIMALPKEAAEFLRAEGFIVPDDMT